MYDEFAVTYEDYDALFFVSDSEYNKHLVQYTFGVFRSGIIESSGYTSILREHLNAETLLMVAYRVIADVVVSPHTLQVLP